MARHYRRRGRDDVSSRWDYDDLTMLGWMSLALAVIVSVAIVWAM
jgi:hypothetical protein